MRLIDADALKKAIDLPFLENIRLGKIINDAPTIDIAEVCGECKPYTPCIYCKHEFENKFETCGADMRGDKHGKR